ncbi:MAG: diguanylate cyclase [Cyanobacteria bacterium TGS_CYA1]|nr:diguanylate cyclase [Cyanobacteria bacterium TGS_CYA1]
MGAVKVILVSDPNATPWSKTDEFENEDITIIQCDSGFAAIDELASAGADAIITTSWLPDMSGYRLCSLIKSNVRTMSMPVYIVKTEETTEETFWMKVALADDVIPMEFLLEEDDALEHLIVRVLARSEEVGWQSDKAKNILLQGASFSSENYTESYGKVVDVLIIERLASRLTRTLIGLVHNKEEFAQKFFELVSVLIEPDVLGFVFGSGETSWSLVEVKGELSSIAFNGINDLVKRRLNLVNDLRVSTADNIIEKGGNPLKHMEILPISGDNGAIIIGFYTKKTIDTSARKFLSQMQIQLQPLLNVLSMQEHIVNLRVENEQMRNQQVMAASTDALTGLYNLEFFIGFLSQQLQFSFRQRLPVGLAIVDVDQLSKINEKFGFEAGDFVIKKVAERLTAITRASDLTARYSGDQFAVVLPNTDLAGTNILGEKVRRSVDEIVLPQFNGTTPPKVTVSIGCANFNMDDLNPETIMRDAKLALVKDKQRLNFEVS